MFSQGFQFQTLSNEEDLTSRIIGGVISPPFGYFVQIMNVSGDGHEKYVCGGSVIDLTYILTAAHCLDGVGKNKCLINFQNFFSFLNMLNKLYYLKKIVPECLLYFHIGS